ncbi:type I restriction endonuclease [Nocardiopsis sp. MG754419]|uniref:type I restriction endonuclease n=1 Tax=Nocardiopsis sp. MG754419 TaxID=2259865 RepID=UPI001BA7AD6E|nr:type I restriction endonuclease [Nocardiopsis sp. MG754419]MBR8741180.1 restriction endonuclease [Nocardiopsis sp. MG754419]
MEFDERVAAVAAKVRQQQALIETEEATKNAFVMPFISTVLGYDVFDPREVVPEFTADVGVKKGEKVDYAVKHDGEVRIIIECKKSRGELTVESASQLYRYFAVTNARIAVLTNGVVYRFYTDLEAPNRMDSTPFLVLDLNDIDESLLPELRKLAKDAFDLDSVINAAEKLKYVGELKRAFATQFSEPEDEWIRFFTTRVYNGQFTRRVREQFTPFVREAATQFLNDQVNSRLKTALNTSFVATEIDDEPDEEVVEEENVPDDGITTTLEELEGYRIVKAIACSEVKPHRVAHRDSKSYFAVLLDDNNRKPIARLHFNGRRRKYLGTFDDDKRETRHLLGSLDDIYLHSELIRRAVRTHSS